MSALLRPLSLALAVALTAVNPGSAAPRASDAAGVRATIRSFLDAYARGDTAEVLRVTAPDTVVFGSDLAERFTGPQGVRRMMDGDRKLWGGPATLGAVRDEALACGGELCAATFHVPFSLPGRPPVMVRISQTWRRTAQGWRLVQSANATPTVGQSAEALLAR